MIEQEGSSQSIPEGMQYGPFPPPELDSDPVGASWIMKRARGDPTLYQNLMLRESLDTSRREGLITYELYQRHKERLEKAASAHMAHLAPQEMRRVKADRHHVLPRDEYDP